MPNVDLPLRDVASTVSRPVITEVVKQLQEIFSIIDPIIIYPGDIGKAKQPGSSIDDKHKRNRTPRLGTTRHTYIEVTEKLVPEGITSHPGHGDEYEPIFRDPNLEVLMRPMYAFTEVEINFKFSSPSRVEALSWYNDCYSMAGFMRQNAHIHSFDYHYNIPNVFIDLLKEIYRCREETGGFGDTLQQWFKACAVPRFTYTTDLVGKNETLSVVEKQGRVVGVVDWGGIPEKPQKNSDQVTWECEFTYKFTFEKPVGINVVYPISVHNQLLPSKYIDFVMQDPSIQDTRKRASNSIKSLHYFEITEIADRYYDRFYEARIPRIDDKVISYSPRYLKPIFTALCLIDPEDPTLFMNLKELDEYTLDTDLLKFLEDGEYRYLAKDFASVLHVSLYRGDRLCPDTELYVDEHLNVRSTRPINIRVQQRIRLSLATDVSILLPGAIKRLVEYEGKAMSTFMVYLNDVLSSEPGLRNVFLGTKLSEHDLIKIYYAVAQLEANKAKVDELNSKTEQELLNEFGDMVGVSTSPREETRSLFPSINKPNLTVSDDLVISDYVGKKKNVSVADILRKYNILIYGKDRSMKTQMNLIIQSKENKWR